MTEPNTDLMYYFTNWNLTTNFAAYLILVVGHIMNNDFGKHWYVEVDPELVDEDSRPYFLWPIATAAYEFATSSAIGVTIAYGTIETYYMYKTDFWGREDYGWYAHILGWVMHTFPQIFMLSEWRYSSIPFSWYRFGIYLFAMTAYSLVNISLEERFDDDIYSSLDWTNKPE